jgi:tetratricopeptide (TPR) repeat protein
MKMTISKIALFAVSLFLAASTSSATADTYSDFIEQGNKFWNENMLDAAEKSFRQAAEQVPEHADAYERLANLYLVSNRIADSIPLFKHAIMLDPENAKLFAGLSLAYLHQQEYSKANAMANQAKVLDPTLTHADKLIEYIALKQAVMAQAAQASMADQQQAMSISSEPLHDTSEAASAAHAVSLHAEQK